MNNLKDIKSSRLFNLHELAGEKLGKDKLFNMLSPLAQTEPLTISSLGAYESRDRINKFRS
ncbi:MAG: hypothetical protein EZS28_041354, partial [Streblomastix strix]